MSEPVKMEEKVCNVCGKSVPVADGEFCVRCAAFFCPDCGEDCAGCGDPICNKCLNKGKEYCESCEEENEDDD